MRYYNTFEFIIRIPPLILQIFFDQMLYKQADFRLIITKTKLNGRHKHKWSSFFCKECIDKKRSRENITMVVGIIRTSWKRTLLFMGFTILGSNKNLWWTVKQMVVLDKSKKITWITFSKYNMEESWLKNQQKYSWKLHERS